MAKRVLITAYEATNSITGDTYIGISRFPAARRWTQHLYNALVLKKCTRFYNAIRKYGRDAFAVTAIASVIDPAHAWEVERQIICERKPTYNLTNGGEWTQGRRVSKETIERIRQANLGKKRTPEQNRCMSERAKARYAARPELLEITTSVLKRARTCIDQGKRAAAAVAAIRARAYSPEERKQMGRRLNSLPRTPEWNANNAAAHKKKVECTTLATVFDSLSEAAEMCGLKIWQVSRVVRGEQTQVRGLEFKLV